MKKLQGIFFLLITCLTGCIPSLHPLYTPNTVLFREELLGTWRMDDGDTWHFEAAANNSYHLTLRSGEETQKGEAEEYEVHLVQLESHYFLDFYPRSKSPSAQDYSLAVVLPTHSFARIELSETQLVIHLFDGDWLGKLFEQRKIRIKHEKLQDGTYILTAPSEDLQKFVVKYAGEAQAYLEPETFQKVVN